jgi:hypothetical protein
MAPEVLCRQNHSYEADFYAVGVILHETMLGKRPFKGKTRKEIREQLGKEQKELSTEHLPNGWSSTVVDLINSLLDRKPKSKHFAKH